MQNTICLTGRLTRDIESKTVNNKTVVKNCIAVDKIFKKEGQDTADFFDFEAWGQPADFLVNYAGKGRLIAISGRQESRKYVDKEGNNRQSWCVKVNEVSVLDRPREGEQGESQKTTGQTGTRGTTPADAVDEYDPFADE